MINWINVKDVAQQYKNIIKRLIETENIHRFLWVISSGTDPASQIYIKGKEKDCKEVGISFNYLQIDKNNLSDLENIIQTIQKSPENKIIVQSPFFDNKINEQIRNCVFYRADADYLSCGSIGSMYSTIGQDYPATARGLQLLLEHFDIDDLNSKRAVVVGRSILAGAPCAKVLQDKGATVTILHSKSGDCKDVLANADVVVLATGRKHAYTDADFKDGAYIFDVGITREEDGKVYGDLNSTSFAKDRIVHATSIPGGMGLMTRVGLLYNIVCS